MEAVIADKRLPETTRQAVVMARRGQGMFKQNVMRLETRCRITQVDQPEHQRPLSTIYKNAYTLLTM
jgi:hypothetical protein